MDETFDPFAAEVTACPYPYLNRLRAEAPVQWSAPANVFLVTTHDLVMEVVRDPARFSSQFGRAGRPVPSEWRQRILAVMADGYPRVPTMLTADPPTHTRFRRLVAKAFSPRSITAMEPTIREICRRLLARWTDGERVEFVDAFAVPLPVEVIARALGVPDGDLGRFKEWSDATTAAIGTDIPLEGIEASERSVNEFQHYFAAQLDERRAAPRDDLLTHLLQAQIDDDDIPDDQDAAAIDDRRPLDLPEILSVLQQLLVAGNETTTALLTDLMVFLGEHPGEWVRLRDDPSRIPRVVEEALRLSTPSSAMWRIATADTTLGGVPIPGGSRLIVTWMSANRDEKLFGAGADGFDPDRDQLHQHVAFGFGTHYCIGAPLSRLEARVALEEMTAAVASFSLGTDNEYRYRPSFFLRGMDRLDVVPTLAAR